MIGVDTNVLIRLFVVDEPQTSLAVAFFRGRSPSDPAYVSLIAVAEFGWVLKKKYRYPGERIAAALQSMLDSDDFVVERRDVVEWVMGKFGDVKVDLSDLLIARVAELAGAPSTVTFDRNAAKRIPGMELLK